MRRRVDAIMEKYPGGIPRLKKRLQAEGHKVVKKGSRYRIVDFEQSLVGTAD